MLRHVQDQVQVPVPHVMHYGTKGSPRAIVCMCLSVSKSSLEQWNCIQVRPWRCCWRQHTITTTTTTNNKYTYTLLTGLHWGYTLRWFYYSWQNQFLFSFPDRGLERERKGEDRSEETLQHWCTAHALCMVLLCGGRVLKSSKAG